ncbi:hypothetical protein LguiA_026184 [Lonicera macranthoides]
MVKLYPYHNFLFSFFPLAVARPHQPPPLPLTAIAIATATATVELRRGPRRSGSGLPMAEVGQLVVIKYIFKTKEK